MLKVSDLDEAFLFLLLVFTLALAMASGRRRQQNFSLAFSYSKNKAPSALRQRILPLRDPALSDDIPVEKTF